ncbi:MAG: hypothetical protein ABIR70_17975 [Bryobacteraceae bacterium]
MPQPADPLAPHDERWAALSRPLGIEEIDDFLDHVFASVARRPETLKLSEVAGVVRRLRWLLDFGVPKNLIVQGQEAVNRFQSTERSKEHLDLAFNVRQISDILWGTLLSCGDITTCSTEEALAFVRRNGSTYLANPYLNSAIEFLEQYDLPPDCESPFKPPYLLSASQSSQGSNPNPHLTDDLSERICGADHALRRTGAAKWRPRIAAALNKAGIQRREGASSTEWLAADVHDREKQYVNSQVLKHPLTEPTVIVEQVRTNAADTLIFAFRWAQYVNAENDARQAGMVDADSE